MYLTVKPIWRDEVCVILAGGPSLRNIESFGPQLKMCQNFITINDSWRLLPSNIKAVNYFCDSSWWSMQLQKNPRSIDGHRSFHEMIYSGFWITIDPGFFDHPQVHFLKSTGQRGLELDPSCLRHGSNSGYQAINLAVHLGAKKIVLLGYDMKVVGYQTNWHKEPRAEAKAYERCIQQSMLPHFPSLVQPLKDLGVEVINANPESELTCFTRTTLEDALRYLQPGYAAPGSNLETEIEGRTAQQEKSSNVPAPLVWEGEMENWRS